VVLNTINKTIYFEKPRIISFLDKYIYFKNNNSYKRKNYRQISHIRVNEIEYVLSTLESLGHEIKSLKPRSLRPGQASDGTEASVEDRLLNKTQKVRKR